MMHLEILDILFFVSSYQNPTNSFDIKNHVEFLKSNTRASRTFTLRHLHSSNTSKHHSYFSRLPTLWNSLPPIDPSSLITGFKTKLRNIFKTHLVNNFNPIIHVLCTLDAPVTNVSNLFCIVCTLGKPIDLIDSPSEQLLL